MSTVDWSEWMTMSREQQDVLHKIYRETLAAERDANERRWLAMTPTQRARYPEPKQ